MVSDSPVFIVFPATKEPPHRARFYAILLSKFGVSTSECDLWNVPIYPGIMSANSKPP